MSKRKPRLPEGLEVIADEAALRRVERYCPPRVRIEKRKNAPWRIVCPYANEDEERWWSLLGEAFATRDPDVIGYFLDCLSKLCPQTWDAKNREWQPREMDFNALLAIVGSVRPENEAQAAYAAQAAALHVSAMKQGERSIEYTDARSAAILNKTVNAFGVVLERMARLQGKLQPRQVNQTIQVVYVDNRDQRNVQFTGGATPNGGQPHAARHARTVEALSALPSPRTDYGQTVPPTRRPWKARLQDAWGAWRGS